MVARTTTLKVRFGDFETVTRRVSSPTPFASAAEILRMARGLIEDIDIARGVRLLGVGVSNLGEDQGQQLSLDLTNPSKDGAGSSAGNRNSEREMVTNGLIDDVRHKFGDAAIGPASATVSGELRVKRRGEQQWGPNTTPTDPLA